MWFVDLKVPRVPVSISGDPSGNSSAKIGDLLLCLFRKVFRGAVSHHGGCAQEQPMKQTEMPTSTMAFMDSFPPLNWPFSHQKIDKHKRISRIVPGTGDLYVGFSLGKRKHRDKIPENLRNIKMPGGWYPVLLSWKRPLDRTTRAGHLRWAKSRENYRAICSENCHCDPNHCRSLALISPPKTPCCVAIRILRLALAGVTLVPCGATEWRARVDCVC